MGRMHYQEWNFIKFARWLALAAERACSKKNQGEKKKRKKEKKCDRLQLPLRIAGINSHTWRGRGVGYYTGGHIVKTCTSSAKCIVKTSNTPPRLFYTADTLPRFFERAWNTLNLIIRCVPPFRPTANPFSRSFVFNVQNVRFCFDRLDRCDPFVK